ncbi:hypothetical protein ACIQNU_11390 [Streptomyces sp. NPDC091292]|uniref:hypothetical protein n=1 Tax=Streptomyces sp. NPDC091292 TaxID=3365991 RepID=UPI00381ED185
MSGESTGPDDVVRFFGITPRLHFEFDWHAVERSIGLRLPPAYKYLAEHTPRGSFQGVLHLIRPGDLDHDETAYLGHYAYRIQDIRAAGTCPYPLHPDVGGLLPWGEGYFGELFFWRTDESDPESWDIVFCDEEFDDWQICAGPLPAFLAALGRGDIRFDGPPAAVGSAPFFREFGNDPFRPDV